MKRVVLVNAPEGLLIVNITHRRSIALLCDRGMNIGKICRAFLRLLVTQEDRHMSIKFNVNAKDQIRPCETNRMA